MQNIWLRHHLGNGKKFGNACEISPDTYLDRESSAGDRAEVISSEIFSSLLADDALVINSVINRSTIAGHTRVINSVVQDVELCHPRVTDGTKLIGPWALSDYVRIHAGIWFTPPRFHVIEGENINVVISECTEDRWHVGCFCKPYKEWANRRYRQMLGKHAGWMPAQIETAFEAFTAWRG